MIVDDPKPYSRYKVKSTMRIGELAARTGVKPETIRFYESEGVLPRPERATNNYRVYGEAHRRRLTFIARLRSLGFHLDEVRALLTMMDNDDTTCADVLALASAHLDEVRGRRRDLERLEHALADLVSRCHGWATPDCSFVETLFEH
jgi:MerR family mercuric resistance operon transcriptional regulator